LDLADTPPHQAIVIGKRQTAGACSGAVTGMTQRHRNVSLITLSHRLLWELGRAAAARRADSPRAAFGSQGKVPRSIVAIVAILQSVDGLRPRFDNAESVG